MPRPLRLLRAAAAVLAAAALVACSGGSGSPEAPSLFLRLPGGDMADAGVGSGCWKGRCLSISGPVTGAEAVALPPSASLALSFEAGLPSRMSADWYQAPEAPAADASGNLIWPVPSGPAVLQGTRAPAAAGRYLFLVQAHWEGQGDLAYGFYVEVIPEAVAGPATMGRPSLSGT